MLPHTFLSSEKRITDVHLSFNKIVRMSISSSTLHVTKNNNCHNNCSVGGTNVSFIIGISVTCETFLTV